MNIIDNVINTVAKEVGKVQERSQEMMQGFNLSNQIKELERKKNAKFMEIGRAIYDKYEHDKEVSEERLKELVAEATAIDHEMAVLQAELDQIKVKNDPDATPTQKAEAKADYSAWFYLPHMRHSRQSRESLLPQLRRCAESQVGRKQESQ